MCCVCWACRPPACTPQVARRTCQVRCLFSEGRGPADVVAVPHARVLLRRGVSGSAYHCVKVRHTEQPNAGGNGLFLAGYCS